MKADLKLLLIYVVVCMCEAAAMYYLVLANLTETLGMTYVVLAGLAIVLAMTVTITKLPVKSFFRIPLFYLLLLACMASFAAGLSLLVKMMSSLFAMLCGIYVLYLNYSSRKDVQE